MNYQHLAHKALYMLRSYPELYGLRKNEKGWVPLPAFLAAMRISLSEFLVLKNNYIGVCTHGKIDVKHGRIRVRDCPDPIEKRLDSNAIPHAKQTQFDEDLIQRKGKTCRWKLESIYRQ